MTCIKCAKCGKFIKESDIPNCKYEEHWSWDKTELDDISYYCLKCTAQLQQKEGES